MKNNIETLIELYIQVTKLTDGNKQLDKNSFNTLSNRYEEYFGNKIEFITHNNKDSFEKIKEECEKGLNSNIADVLEILKIKFNQQHNKLQTSNTYNAIAYDEESVIREIFQNIFDRKYFEDIKIELSFDDLNKKITIQYNESGFDLKSLIFYFNAGDSAKNNEQTGKFGLGIKSVMYNVQSLTCETICDNNKFSWRVKKSISYENTQEIKKSLELIDLKMDKMFKSEVTGTALTIELKEEMYKGVKENFDTLESGSNRYIDIPELIFALKSSNTRNLILDINNEKRYLVKSTDNDATFNNLNFTFFNGRKDGYIKEILYLNTEINTNIFEKNKSLYATYKMLEDRTLEGRSGSVFLSIKSEYVVSTRKALKNADSIKQKILEEAEEFICCLANAENNKSCFTVDITDDLKVDYSVHLRKFMHFIKTQSKIEELFKNIKCPEKTVSGKEINYYYHSAIAKVGHTRYSESYRYNDLVQYESNSIWNHQNINESIELLIRKINETQTFNSINIFVDMFNAKFDGSKIDFNSVVININGKNNQKINELIKVIYAPKINFKNHKIYGNNGSYCYYKDYCYFKNNTLKNLFEKNESYYSILAMLKLNNEQELKKCYDALKAICDKVKVVESDSDLFEALKDSYLNNKFKDDIDIIKKFQLEKRLKNNEEITFQKLLKYNDVIDITKVSIGKTFDFIDCESFYSKFLPKNQERLEKIISTNSHVEDFTENSIKRLLDRSFLFNCDKNQSEYIIVIDKDDKIIKIEKYTNFKDRLQIKYYNPSSLFYDLKELINNQNKFIWFTSKKRITHEIEAYIDSFLMRIGNDDKNLKGFSSIADIKVKTLHTDQSPQDIKLTVPFRKKSFCYLVREISEYLKSHENEYKSLIYRDFSSELFGNGYCCCISDCDFDVANEYAYDILYLTFQNYNLPIYVCQNHKMILSNTQIHIDQITVGDKNISEIFNYIENLSDEDFIVSQYRKVRIKYTHKFNTDSFNPSIDISQNNEEYDETTEDYSEQDIKLSPVNFAVWYCLNKNSKS